MDFLSWVAVGAVLLLILILSISKKMLDVKGIVIGFLTALFVAWQGGLGSFAAIIVFFLIGEAVTRFTRKMSKRKEHGMRSVVNIVGNIGPALIGLAVNPVGFNVMFFTSLSAAFADTLSSEIGVLSREKPLMITTLKPAQPGEDGAVSVLGFAAAAVGGLIFGILGFLVTHSLFWGALLVLAGLLGSVVDSVVGATLQRRGLLDNNLVNFVSALLVGVFFALLF